MSLATVWADTTDYSDSKSGLGRTHQIDLTSLASGAARQGAKADLAPMGWTSINDRWLCLVCIEPVGAPTSKEVVDFWWAGSPAETAGDANPGGTTGADAAYTGTAGDDLDDSLEQLIWIGAISATADILTQYAQVGVLTNIPRHGMPVVDSGLTTGSVAMVANATEMYVALVKLHSDSQI